MNAQDAVILVVLILLLVVVIAIVYASPKKEMITGGGQRQRSFLTKGGKDVIAKNARSVFGGKKITEMEGGEVAEYVMKASRDHSDLVATELKSLKSDIVNVIGGYPGLVEYVGGINPRTENKLIKDAIEDIQDSLRRKRRQGGSADDYNISLGDPSSEFEPSFRGGGSDDIVSDAIATIRPYLREAGTSRHFLARVSKELGSGFKYSKKTDKAKLEEGLEAMVDEYRPDSVESLISKSGISYEWFVPAAKRGVLQLADSVEDDVDIAGSDALASEFRDYVKASARKLGKSMLPKKTVRKILQVAEPALKMLKLKRAHAKKTKAAVKKLKENAFEPDVVGLMPLLQRLADSAYKNSELYEFFAESKKLVGEKVKESVKERIRDAVRESSGDADDEEKAAKAKREEEVLRELRWRKLQELKAEEIRRQQQEIADARRKAAEIEKNATEVVSGLLSEQERLREALREEAEEKARVESALREEREQRASESEEEEEEEEEPGALEEIPT
jgi:hypothetical protein